MQPQTASIYEIIQAQLLAKLRDAIEGGEPFTWVKPWKGAPYPCSYENPKIPFRAAVNFLFLEAGEYLTYNQIQNLRTQNPEVKIRKGAKQAYVYMFFPVYKKERDGTTVVDENQEPLLDHVCVRYLREFHISDVEHVKSHFIGTEYKHEETEKMALADQLIQAYAKKYEIEIVEQYGTGRAYCQGRKIVIPAKRQFESCYEYYGTIFHELGHVTNSICPRSKKLEYAQEELVAELTSSLLCSILQLKDDRMEKNNLAYLRGWYEKIKNGSPKIIFSSTEEARKAANQILDASPLIKGSLLQLPPVETTVKKVQPERRPICKNRMGKR